MRKAGIVLILSQQQGAITAYHIKARSIENVGSGGDDDGEGIGAHTHRGGEDIKKFTIARLCVFIDNDGAGVESVFGVGVGGETLRKGRAVGSAAFYLHLVVHISALIGVELAKASAHDGKTFLCLVGTIGARVALGIGIAKQHIING